MIKITFEEADRILRLNPNAISITDAGGQQYLGGFSFEIMVLTESQKIDYDKIAKPGVNVGVSE